jgi:hypothetical protein
MLCPMVRWHNIVKIRSAYVDDCDMARQKPFALKQTEVAPHLACAPSERIQVRLRLSPGIVKTLRLLAATQWPGEQDAMSRAIELAVSRAFGRLEVFSVESELPERERPGEAA